MSSLSARAVPQAVGRGLVLTMTLATLAACGGAPEPTEEEIWHRSSLRPGEVAPETQGERELLAHLPDVPAGEPVTFAGQVFVAEEPYQAASGRTCRSVTVRSSGAEGEGTLDVKLACEEPMKGIWVFVPDPFADAPVAAELSQDATSGGGAP